MQLAYEAGDQVCGETAGGDNLTYLSVYKLKVFTFRKTCLG